MNELKNFYNMDYIVEQSDLTGNFKGYPVEIIQLLIKRAEQQGNNGKRAFEIIRHKLFADKDQGGVNWAETPEGHDFWSDILNTAKPLEERLRIFHEKYPKLTYPRIMEVSDFEDFCDLNRRVVIAKHNGMFIAWRDATNFEDAESKVSTKPWRYAREIDDSIIELTIEEIAEKLNIDSSKLRIKK